MRLYHGIDIVETSRIAQAATRWGNRFLQRVFTPQELSDCGGRAPSLAARWAAKEATAKALGVGLRGIGAHAVVGDQAVGWLDIEVQRGPRGEPSLQLHGTAAVQAEALGWQSMVVSLSHTGDIAMASVVALGDTR